MSSAGIWGSAQGEKICCGAGIPAKFFGGRANALDRSKLGGNAKHQLGSGTNVSALKRCERVYFPAGASRVPGLCALLPLTFALCHRARPSRRKGFSVTTARDYLMPWNEERRHDLLSWYKSTPPFLCYSPCTTVTKLGAADWIFSGVQRSFFSFFFSFFFFLLGACCRSLCKNLEITCFVVM